MSNQKDKNALGLQRGLSHYGDEKFSLYLRRIFARSMGYGSEMLDKSIVGICHSSSGFNNCHRDMPALIDAVKRGVLAAGALPIDFPTISLGESFLTPTSLKYRNLMSMDVEEMIRAQPMDAVVLVGGCDKTVPAQLMGAASADIPTVQLVTGPMSTSRYHSERLGACTDCRRFWASYRAGKISHAEIDQVESRLASTTGTCAVMGTASTMASIAEALGMMPAGAAAVPATDADRLRIAEASGTLAVSLIGSDRIPSRVITAKSLENAWRVLLAIGGSTNAVIHLTAIAGRLGLPVDLHHLNELSDTTPVLVDLKPSGSGYMEDLAAAGGIPAVMRELKPLLHLDCLTVTGETIGERLDAWDPWVDRSVIRPFNEPLQSVGGLVALFGNLAPNGAILKRAAADSALFEKEGRCVVFNSLEDLANRIDAPDLDVMADDILVLKNAGPKSEACMPEAGHLPIPKKLALAGVKDIMRISDARMSGTAYGSVILHVSPDSASGGPLALLENGDCVRLSVSKRSLELLVDDATLATRRAKAPPAPDVADNHRGHSWLHDQFMTQAEQGCDFSFLRKGGLKPAR
jgi:dihydroxy-acid dehydratase